MVRVRGPPERGPWAFVLHHHLHAAIDQEQVTSAIRVAVRADLPAQRLRPALARRITVRRVVELEIQLSVAVLVWVAKVQAGGPGTRIACLTRVATPIRNDVLLLVEHVGWVDMGEQVRLSDVKRGGERGEGISGSLIYARYN